MLNINFLTLRRNLIDWRDDWLVEGAFILSRESRLLMLDMSSIPLSKNPINWFGEDAARGEAVKTIIDEWLEVIQVRLINKAWEDLKLIAFNHGSDQSSIRIPSAPILVKSPVGRSILEAGWSANWQKDLPSAVWAKDGSSLFFDRSWTGELNKVCESILRDANEHTV